MTGSRRTCFRLGYQEIDQIDNQVPCCLDTSGNDVSPEMFRCDTKVEDRDAEPERRQLARR